jgi:hypothetical protein
MIEDLPKIFDEGFTTKEGEKGGLGLYLTREYLKLRGGKIQVDTMTQDGIPCRLIFDDKLENITILEGNKAPDDSNKRTEIGTTFTATLPLVTSNQGTTKEYFNDKGIATDKKGEELAIENYQMAINKIIAWMEKNNIPVSDVMIIGSFARFDEQLPRLGIANLPGDWVYIAVSHRFTFKDYPSDIDIFISTSGVGRQGYIENRIKPLKKEIIKELGVIVQVWFKKDKDSPVIPISYFSGTSLIDRYKKLYAPTIPARPPNRCL